MTLFSDSMAIVVSGLFSDGSLNEGLQFVNANRVYRIMSENNLLLLHDKPSRPQREHKGPNIGEGKRPALVCRWL
ncbi:transposase InsD for insertion element IS2A/D/F/H/I/K [Escherichia coli H420]|nr:transposase InsD for insertion element IS2A/D/F/H/I/K [Escherichia coli H420]SJK91299.1 hypothetical protein RCEC007_930021 [Escherichia coli]